MRLSRYSEEIDSQASTTICRSLSPGTLLLPSSSGKFFCMWSFIESQTCSIGLRSGENGGHGRRLIPLRDNSAFVARALWEGALSCISKRDRLLRTFPCVSGKICYNRAPPSMKKDIWCYLFFYQGNYSLTVLSSCDRPPFFFPEKEWPFFIPRKRSPEHPAARSW